MRPEPEEKVVEEGTFGGTKEKTVDENTGDQGGGQNWRDFSSSATVLDFCEKLGINPELSFSERPFVLPTVESEGMRVFTGAVLIMAVGILSLTGCAETQVVDVRPKSGAMLIDSTDVLYLKGLLAETAKDYDLEPQNLVSSEMIASYQGGKKGPFSPGVALILLWQYTNPSHLELDISGPSPVGPTRLSKRIFKEVKAKLIEHFGSDRVRDVSKAVISPIWRHRRMSPRCESITTMRDKIPVADLMLSRAQEAWPTSGVLSTKMPGKKRPAAW
jgi:hypothetical protein